MEQDAAIALTGRIGIQVHGGGKALVEVKDIRIEKLPANAATSTSMKAGNAEGALPRSAAEEAA